MFAFAGSAEKKEKTIMHHTTGNLLKAQLAKKNVYFVVNCVKHMT